MRNSSCVEPDEADDASILPWCTQTVDWPYELVVVQVEVVVPRALTALEWALSRVLEEFEDDPATLVETATELGVKDPVVLVETLQVLVELGAAEPRDGRAPVDLSDFRLTGQGKKLLATGQIAGLPERHGLHLVFDALTGEHLRDRLSGTSTKPEAPIVAPESLPERVQVLGLDRVRRLAREQAEQFQLSEAHIQQSTVCYREGGRRWRTMRVDLALDAQDVLHARLHSSSAAQQAYLDQSDSRLELFARLSRASTGAWRNGHCVPHVPITPKDWVGLAEEPVDPSQTAKKACALVRTAREEVIAQAGWLDAPDFKDQFDQADRRGVRCFICAADASGPPLAVVADRRRGLRVDTVRAQTRAGKPLNLELAATVIPSQLPALRQELLSAATQTLTAVDQEAHQMKNAGGGPEPAAATTDIQARRAS